MSRGRDGRQEAGPDVATRLVRGLLGAAAGVAAALLVGHLATQLRPKDGAPGNKVHGGRRGDKGGDAKAGSSGGRSAPRRDTKRGAARDSGRGAGGRSGTRQVRVCHGSTRRVSWASCAVFGVGSLPQHLHLPPIGVGPFATKLTVLFCLSLPQTPSPPDAAGDEDGGGGGGEQGGGGDGHLSDSGSTVLAQRLPPGSPLPASALRVPFRPKLGVPPHLSLGDGAAGGSGSGGVEGGRTAGSEAPARPQDEDASPQAGWVRAPPELRHLPTQPSGLDLGAPGLTQAELAVWGAAAAIAATRGSALTQYEEDGASIVSTPPGAAHEHVVQQQVAYTAPAVSASPLAVPSRPAPAQQVTAAALLGADAGVDPLAAASQRRREEGLPSNVEHHASFMRPVAPPMPSRTRSLLGATGSSQPQRPTAQPMPSSSALAAPQPVVPSRRPPSVDAYREGYLEGQREAEQALAVQRQQSDSGVKDGMAHMQQQQQLQQTAPVYDQAAPQQQSSYGDASNQAAKRAALAAVAEAARQRAAARNASRATVRERAQQEQARAHARVVDPYLRDGGSRGESPVYGEAGAAAFQRSRPFSPDQPPAASGDGANNSGWADALSSVPQAAVIQPLVPPPQSGAQASALQPSLVLTQQQQSRPTAPFFEARRQDLRARVEAAAARAAAAADAGVSAEVVNVYAAAAAQAKRASPTFSPRTGRPGAPPSAAAASSGAGLYEEDD